MIGCFWPILALSGNIFSPCNKKAGNSLDTGKEPTLCRSHLCLSLWGILFLKVFWHQFLNYYTVYPFCMQVMKNQEAVDLVKSIKDPQAAAKRLTTEALARKSKDDISCIVIRFRCWMSHAHWRLRQSSVIVSLCQISDTICCAYLPNSEFLIASAVPICEISDSICCTYLLNFW